MQTRLTAAAALLALIGLPSGRAEAQQAQLTKLSDVAFGVLSTIGSDASISQNVCAFSSSASGLYSVRAVGSGAGGALTLGGTSTPLAYDVQWAASPNQSSGRALPANTTVGGFNDLLVVANLCTVLNPVTASLIVTLRSASLSGVEAGSSSGTLTLVIAAQ